MDDEQDNPHDPNEDNVISLETLTFIHDLWTIYRYNGTEMLSQEDTIATEAPLTIKIEWRGIRNTRLYADRYHRPSHGLSCLRRLDSIRGSDRVAYAGRGAGLRSCQAASSPSIKPKDGVQALHRFLLREKPPVLFSQRRSHRQNRSHEAAAIDSAVLSSYESAAGAIG